MRKTIILISSIVLTISLLVVSVLALTSAEQEESVQLTTYEAIIAEAKSKNGTYFVEKLDQKEIFSDMSTENLKQIFEAFDVIIDSNDTIEVVKEAQDYVEISKEFKSTADGKYTIDTTADRTQLKLAMLVSVYFTNFPNAIAPWYLDTDPNMINIAIIPFIYISFDYAEYGFDNAVDYLLSCRIEDPEYIYKMVFDDNTFTIDPYHRDIYLTRDGYIIGSPAPNLISFATDGLTFREQLLLSASPEEIK